MDRADRRRKDTALPGGRRDDDPDVELAKRFVWWGRAYATHKATVTAALMLIAGAVAWVGVAAMIEPRVTKLETSMVSVQADVKNLKDGEETKMFMLCTIYMQLAKHQPLPSKCANFVILP